MSIDILFVTHGFNLGGAEVLVVKMACQLPESYSSAVLALDQSGDLQSELDARGIKNAVVGRKPGWQLKNFSEFFKYVRAYSPRLIHAHQYTPFLYSVLYKILFNWNCKLIFTEHGRHLPDLVSFKRKLANQVLSLFINRVTAVCEFTKRSLTSNEKLPNAIQVIYNGIDLEAQSAPSLRAEFGISDKDTLIGYVGSLRSIKNPAFLITALGRVKTKNSNIKLVLIGEGSLKLDLIKLAEQLEITSDVYFAGSRFPASAYISQFDIFVQPSLCEAHSLALLESMARAVPAIVTNVGGASESIQDGVNGLLVESNSVESLSDAILNLINNAELRSRLALAGRESYQQRFTFNKMFSQYLELYDELLS